MSRARWTLPRQGRGRGRGPGPDPDRTTQPGTTWTEIVRGMRAISADTALRLGRCFGTSERFWRNLQTHYDLEVEKDRLGDRLTREVKVLSPSGASRTESSN